MFFSKSDKIIEDVHRHSDIVKECYIVYMTQFENISQDIVIGNLTDFETDAILADIKELEHKGDGVRREVIRGFLQGGMLVDNRKSTMRLLEGLDTVADYCEDILEKIIYEQMLVPQWFFSESIKINNKTYEMLLDFNEVLDQTVSNYNFDEILKTIQSIELMETEIDTIETRLTQKIFKSEYELAEKVQLKHLLDYICSISDLIEDLSDEVEIILASRRI